MTELLAKATIDDIAFNIVGGMIIATMIAVIIYFVKEIYDAYTLHKCKKQGRAKYKVGDKIKYQPFGALDVVTVTVVKVTDRGLVVEYIEGDEPVEIFFDWEHVSHFVK